MKWIKKHKSYLFVLAISILLLGTVFAVKGIYPFGKNSLIYGDMYEQITPYYYHFYDAMKGDKSLLFDFGTSLGLNFFGIIAYYLLSPFTFLVLLVKRSEIYLVVSCIVAFKMILANLTCHYMLRKLFPKASSTIHVFLALLYGFSIYSLSYYQITPWMDAMYLFPLIIVGLKKLWEENRPAMYMITLTISLCCSFYVSLMMLIMLFFLSIFAIRTYFKQEQKQKILSLGMTTVISLLCSMVVILPSYYQISHSARMGYGLETLLNSKLGPIIDKTTLFLFGPVLLVSIFFLLKDYRKHKKFLSFYIPSMMILLIPYLVEPVLKLLHFGSYASFPYRFGFMTVIFLILGSAYYFQSLPVCKENPSILKKGISMGVIAFVSIVSAFLLYHFYDRIQAAIEVLTFTRDKLVPVLLLAIFLLFMGTIFFLFMFLKGWTPFLKKMTFLLSIIHIGMTCYLYVGIDFFFANSNQVYPFLAQLSTESTSSQLKNETTDMISNLGLVSSYRSLDHFSSLTNANSQKLLKQFGYSSYWTRTTSKGGTLFSDIFFTNQYLLTDEKEVVGYQKQKQYDDYFIHQYPTNLSFGYLVEEEVSLSHGSAFDYANALYQAITKKENLFEILLEPSFYHIQKENQSYEVKEGGYATFDIPLTDSRMVYLQISKSLDNQINEDIFENFNIWVNEEEILTNAITQERNGVLFLGTYDTDIHIKIEFLNSCELEILEVGLLNPKELEDFLAQERPVIIPTIHKNKLTLDIDSKTSSNYLVPLIDQEGYQITRNGKKIETKSMMNLLEIPLVEGENHIEITFIPPTLPLGIVLSLIGFVLMALFLVPIIFQKVVENSMLQNATYYLYYGIYGLSIFILYVLPILAFIVSFMIPIRL